MTLSKPARLGLCRLVIVLGILTLALLSEPLARINRRFNSLPSHLPSVMAVYGADVVSIDRNARDFKLLDQIDWQGRPGSSSQTATVFGDPSKAGLYVQLLKRGPNDWSRPHSHPNDRYLTVLKGTMLIGTGTKFDPNNTVPLGQGA